MTDTTVHPFKIAITSAEFEFLNRKLSDTRLSLNLANEKWAEENGVTLEFMQETLTFWRNNYDWRHEESRLNLLPQYTTTIYLPSFDPLDIHFLHSPCPSPSPNSIPLLFLHGWPGSFIEVAKALPGLNELGYHVVAPSLPGFGFSTCPLQPGFNIRHIAILVKELMHRLGYTIFVVQGGDWGAMIAWTLATYHPECVSALHINLLSLPKPDFRPGQEPKYTDFEKRTLAQHKNFDEHEFAYYLVQNTKPRTFGFALHDSPIGMAAWMADKLFTWSDHYPWTKGEIITWTLLHWFPGPTGAFQIYRENSATEMVEGARSRDYLTTPTFVSAFKGEAEMVPRSWAERKARIVGWYEHNRGGHFAAWENPDAFVGDLRKVAEFVRGAGGMGEE